MPISALFFDLSGVLYQGDERLPGADHVIAQARRNNFILRFVTNTATKSRQEILQKLASLGIDARADELFTAPDAAQTYISQHQLRPFALVHPAIRPLFTHSESNANCVVIGDARDGLTYESLNRAFRLLMNGSPLVGIGDNRYFQDEHGLSLDAGPFIHALAYAAGVEPIIMGKPSRAFFEQVVRSTGLTAGQCFMVGDDVRGDVEGALNTGIGAALVQTGKYQPGDEGVLSQNFPCFANVSDIFKLIEY
ncbi:TIGR01458 family HAD-type hydrolase [Gilvimarinus sp. SDUM040013]|uniref:Haloacid dehalogenase-like hydrolase domain-containing protein 2 n=1 Tax=Gilvimarinus gilvus TaxID=3058038 RepID=A0ABU4RYX1_9GAMM|nr:TIGR01458 family HAD-type hydrolase [Gilvimarinus sp. SDUM040013]MDO3384586.1 TIGR01458 family HAD-type hydrolase [Gilvimarinus sp. SDUM040013]MDX6850078.1 TIGR01458 family HAD-type hydrolase [Gilvimarinus sp. SDUM040013]